MHIQIRNRLIATALGIVGINVLGASLSRAAQAAPSPTLPPTPFSYYALGDSITEGRQAKVHYPKLVGAAIDAATTTNLGINAETAVGAVADELPQVPPHCGVATVYIGLNDAQFIMLKRETPADFRASISTIVATLRQRCSVVAIATIAHNANVFAQRYGSGYDRQIDAENEQIAGFASLPGVIVTPLNADPQMHDIANYNALPAGLYFIHPNTAGAERIAKDFLDSLQVKT